MNQKINRILGCFWLLPAAFLFAWEIPRILQYGLVLEVTVFKVSIAGLILLFLLLAAASFKSAGKDLMGKLNLTFFALFLLSPLIGEMTIRTGIRLNMDVFKRPYLYANQYQDNSYWALRYIWFSEEKQRSRRNWHPLFGWSQTIHDDHNPLGLALKTREQLRGTREKILFYGDSFVRGAADPEYQLPEFLNDRIENKDVIDLSVGGFGLDQIYLMLRETHAMAEKPVILIGILLGDLDRALLKVRTYKKPYFELNADSQLVLKGVPVQSDEKEFIRQFLPKSYFLNLLRITFLNKDKPGKADMKLYRRLIESMQTICKEEAADCEAVIFYGIGRLKDTDWRETYLKTELKDLNLPFVDTKPILLNYAEQENIDVTAFYKGNYGHHNNLGNQVIGEGILAYLTEKNLTGT